MKDLKNKNAITLLALIIAVIVLLILATVSISLVINSGILDHAQQGVNRYSEEEELEQIKLAVASAKLKGNGFLTTENLNSELQDNFGKDKEAKPIDDYWKFNGFKIISTGQVERTLSKEFQEVEYIESTGTQYIDTGVKNHADINISTVASANSTNCETLFRARTSRAGSNDIGILFSSENNIIVGLWNIFWGWEEKIPTNLYMGKHKFEIKNRGFFLDNNLQFQNNSTTLNVESSEKMYIFAMNNSPNPVAYGSWKIYSMTIDQIRNFIPCYSTTTVTDVDGIERPKDTIGLYDTVEGKFYVNKGTGTFLKGNDV